MNDEADSCDENSIRYNPNHDSQGFESSCQNKDSNGTTTADTSGVEKRKDNFGRKNGGDHSKHNLKVISTKSTKQSNLENWGIAASGGSKQLAGQKRNKMEDDNGKVTREDVSEFNVTGIRK